MSLHKKVSRADRRYLPVSLLALLTASSGLAQEAKPAAAQPAPASGDEDIVVLSPFIVDASKDQGYYAENTLAGSRLNTKISDLAPSISVITKQLLEDTASVDVNDIFRYEINTEGSLTYTPAVQSMRSDGIADINSGFASGGIVQNGTNATANRVRGLGSPTASINYYPAISSVPMDAYNLSTVEINRGPNSLLFGMGSPAGIVNQSTQTAVLTRDSNTVTGRMDSNGSFRSTVAFNRALIKDKLAIYGAAAFDDRRFERKPSYDNTRRYYGALTFKPFSGTTIKANAEYYKNDNRRPNSLTPRDYVTEWYTAGQPVYDSTNRTITRMSDGKVLGVYVSGSSSPYAQSVRSFIGGLSNYNSTLWGTGTNINNATTYNGVSIFGDTAMTSTSSVMYAPGIAYVNKGRTIQQIVDGQMTNWFMPLLEQTYKTGWGTDTAPDGTSHTFPIDSFSKTTSGPTTTALWANPTWASMYNRGYTSSTGWSSPRTANGYTVSGYKYTAVTDKSIYDWSNLNLNEMNFGKDNCKTFNVELEQKILDNLFFNAGWFRQNFESRANYTVAQLNVATLFVDTNKYMPDGSLNPMLGKVYVEDQDADYTISTQDNDNYRAMLAYTPDFTKNKGWTKWFGKHQILGLWSRTESMSSVIRRRLLYTDSSTDAGKYRFLPNENDKLDGTATGWNYGSNGVRRMFYLANASDPNGVATQASGEWYSDSYTGYVNVYDYASSTPQMVDVTQEWVDHDATTGRNQRTLDSLSAGITDYLWENRLVTTFGVRRDENRTRSTTNGAILSGFRGDQVAPAMTNAEKWIDGVYQTDTVFNRWNYWDKLTGTTTTMGGVFKPFTGWNSIEKKANSGSFLWQFIRDFGLSYNKSDNFDAPAISQVDCFGVPLPKSVGNGKDYGFQFSLFENRFFARVTWFEGTNENERTNPGSSISRLTGNVDTTLFRNWARTIAMINMGMDPTASSFGSNLTATQETAVQDAAAKIWQLPYTYYGDIGTIYATRTAEAKGVELQLNYNPIPNWTMRLTAGKQTTTYSNVLREFDAWYAVRAPIWKSAKASDYLLPQYQNLATYTNSSGRSVDLTNFWSSFGYRDEIKGTDEVNGYYNPELYYNGVVSPQIAQNRDLEGQAAPGQRRYRWSFMTNYQFSTGWLKGFAIGGGQRWEDKAIIGYLGKSSGLVTNIPGYMDMSDVTKPVYDSENWYTDVWISYTRKVFRDKIRMKIQLNVDDMFEDGGLRVTSINYDGSPYAYRIIDSRLFKLTTTFEF
jgi:outer membrane receptor protein involved in Fe transport